MGKVSSQQTKPTLSKKECASVRVYFRINLEKRVELYFLKRSLSAEIRLQYFSRGYFEMPSSYELPPILLKRLGIDSCILPKGIYPITEDSDFIKVCF